METKVPTTTKATEFAPAERASESVYQATVQALANNPLVTALLNAGDMMFFLLNRQRQVVAVNESAALRLMLDPIQTGFGHRPGEMMQCTLATKGPNGCGTGNACQVCGIVNTILESQKTHRVSEAEGLLTIRQNGVDTPVEFLVRATPVVVQGQPLTILSLRDISEQRRREVLERLFLHDIRNTLSGLYGWTQFLLTNRRKVSEEAISSIHNLVNRLNLEIQFHADLLAAESGRFEAKMEEVALDGILKQATDTVEPNLLHEGKKLQVTNLDKPVMLRTDPRLLLRVLINMLKNAEEATQAGDTIKLWCQVDSTHCKFLVQNPGVMSKEVAFQIFRRSFSTKGSTGRGLGTYSMKLFGEKILHGQVGFQSDKEHQTLFWISLPR